MEALISQFTFLSGQALQDREFDPSTMEDLMKLFEIESYKAWAAVELEQELKEVEEAEVAMQQDDAENYLNSVMESAMDEFWGFEEEEEEAELERMSRAEVDSLVETADQSGRNLEKEADSVASKRYIEAEVDSATASMISAWGKVHPS